MPREIETIDLIFGITIAIKLPKTKNINCIKNRENEISKNICILTFEFCIKFNIIQEVLIYVILVINKHITPANSFAVRILFLLTGLVKRKSAVLNLVSLDTIDNPIFIACIAPQIVTKEKI